ncbi:MAG: hypothetical protein GY898_30340 [Proteobacteria bacterium]|nr:hypothetical protein [Pseudomonadota bacterium]
MLSWSFMWFGRGELDLTWIIYLFTPLWWGFIVALDGLAYARAGGHSILADRPKRMIGLVVMSVVGWYSFEWLSWFVNNLWYYPLQDLLGSQGSKIFWFTLTFTCVWPALFEMYALLRTTPGFVTRWSKGPSVQLSTRALFLLGAAGLFLSGLFPRPLFWMIWIGSLAVMAPAMLLCGYWTPLPPLAKGDWTPFVGIAVAMFALGIFWELWNYGEQAFFADTDPNYWEYAIPYVQALKVPPFEMPLPGFLGYLPLGAQCWVWYLLYVHLFSPPDATHDYELGAMH